MPRIGIFAVAICTVLAVAILPGSVSEDWSLRGSCVVMSLGLITPVLIAFLKNHRSILHPANILGMAPIFWLLLEPIQARWEPGPCGIDEVSTVFMAMGCFTVSAWLACSVATVGVARKVPSRQVEFSPNTLFRIGVISFLIALLRFAVPCEFNPVLMFQGLGMGRWDAPWSRGSTGGFDAIIDHFSYFAFLIPPLTARLIVLTRWLDRRVIILGVLAFVIAIFLSQNGGRRITGVLSLSFFFVLNVSSAKMRLKNLATAGLAVIALMFVSQAMLQYRNVGFASILADRSELKVPRRYDYFHVDSNFRSCAEMAYYVPSKHPYVTYQYLLWVAARPIPRILWPGKPLHLGFDLAAESNQKGVSLSMTVIGEAYVAFGLTGVGIAGACFGLLASLAASVLRFSRTTGDVLLGSILTLCVFAGMRSGIDLVLMSYPMLAWWLVVWFFGASRSI